MGLAQPVRSREREEIRAAGCARDQFHVVDARMLRATTGLVKRNRNTVTANNLRWQLVASRGRQWQVDVRPAEARQYE